MQRTLVVRKATPFFSLCWTALKKAASLVYRIFWVIIPNSIQGVIWAVRTTLKLFCLSVGLLVLLVGPRIGLPKSIQQATWGLLIRLGCLTADDVVRLGRGAANAAAQSGETSTVAVAGQIVRIGVRNLDVSVASEIITTTVKGVVSEMFWAVVDALGYKAYFQNVARRKEQLSRAQHAPAVSSEVVPESSEAEVQNLEGQQLAIILHRIEVTGEWGISRAQHLWQRTQEVGTSLKQSRENAKQQRAMDHLQEQVRSTEQVLSEAEASASFSIKLALDAEVEAKTCAALLREAEEEYELALVGVGEEKQTPPPEREPEPSSSGGGGWFDSLIKGISPAHDEVPASQQKRIRLSQAEENLCSANAAAVSALQEREIRVKQRAAAIAALSDAETAHISAVEALKKFQATMARRAQQQSVSGQASVSERGASP